MAEEAVVEAEEAPETTTETTPQGEPESKPDVEGGEGEEKPSGEESKSLLGDKGEVEETKEAEVPESYEFKFPEGLEVDKAMLEKADPIFKELKLSQEQAQKVVDLYAGQVEAQAKQYQEMTEGWKNDTIKELGADYQKELSVASRFIDKFGGDDVREVLNDTGLGNHPKIVSLFIKAGKAISDDSFVDGSNKNKPMGEEQLARKLFNNTKY